MSRSAVMGIVCMVCVALSLAGCKPTVPSTFIPKDEMEDILYDYHLADAMARLNPNTHDQDVIAYRAAVLKKYGIDQAKFDTSMVYYMRHTDDLHAIYQHIAERMEKEAKGMGSSVGSLADGTGYHANGDTVDIWRGERSLALTPSQPYNLYTFSYKADSAFHRGDSFALTFHSDFVFQDGSRDGIASLVVIFDNDSVTSRVIHVSSSASQEVRIDNNDSLKVREVKGYMLLSPTNQESVSSTTLHLMVMSHIHLYRMHPQRRAPQPKTDNDMGPVPDSIRRRGADMPANQDSSHGVRPLV